MGLLAIFVLFSLVCSGYVNPIVSLFFFLCFFPLSDLFKSLQAVLQCELVAHRVLYCLGQLMQSRSRIRGPLDVSLLKTARSPEFEVEVIAYGAQRNSPTDRTSQNTTELNQITYLPYWRLAREVVNRTDAQQSVTPCNPGQP